MPGIVVEAEGWKVGAKLGKTVVLRTRFRLEVAVGLSDIVRSSEKDANPSDTRLASQGLRRDCMCVMWQPIPEHLSSRGNIQEVER
jgi:hypothetical protein